MIVYTVTEKNRVMFSSFVPADVLMAMGHSGHFSLGLFDDEMNLEPAGYAQFYAGYEDSDESKPYVRVDWLSVKEESRYMGGGTQLVRAIIDIAKKGGSKRIEIKFHDEQLQSILEKEGFEFKDGKRYLMDKSLAECFDRHKLLEGETAQEVKPISQLTKREWNDLLINAPAELAANLRQAVADKDLEGYDPNTSCVYTKNGEVSGILMVRQLASGAIQINPLREFHGKDPKIILYMLKFAAKKAQEKYKPDQTVRVESNTDAALRLIEKVFPNDEPEDIKVGQLSLQAI